MGVEDRVENHDHFGYRLPWEMLQDPIRNTVGARRLNDLETSDSFLNLLRVGQNGCAGSGHEVRPQRLVNNHNNCQNRRISFRLKLSLQIVGKGFGFLRA